MAKIKFTIEIEDNEGYFGKHDVPFIYSYDQYHNLSEYNQSVCLQNMFEDISHITDHYDEILYDLMLKKFDCKIY